MFNFRLLLAALFMGLSYMGVQYQHANPELSFIEAFLVVTTGTAFLFCMVAPAILPWLWPLIGFLGISRWLVVQSSRPTARTVRHEHVYKFDHDPSYDPAYRGPVYDITPRPLQIPGPKAKRKPRKPRS